MTYRSNTLFGFLCTENEVRVERKRDTLAAASESGQWGQQMFFKQRLAGSMKNISSPELL